MWQSVGRMPERKLEMAWGQYLNSLHVPLKLGHSSVLHGPRTGPGIKITKILSTVRKIILSLFINWLTSMNPLRSNGIRKDDDGDDKPIHFRSGHHTLQCRIKRKRFLSHSFHQWITEWNGSAFYVQNYSRVFFLGKLTVFCIRF